MATAYQIAPWDGILNVGVPVYGAYPVGPFGTTTTSMYTVLAHQDPPSGPGAITAYLSTDAGVTWNEQDSAHHPALTNIVNSTNNNKGNWVSSFYDATANQIRVASWTLDTSAITGTATINLTYFDCSSNTWGSNTGGGPAMITISTLVESEQTFLRVSQRSTGEQVVMFGVSTDTNSVGGNIFSFNMVSYSTATGWGTTQTIGTTTTTANAPFALASGSNGNVHAFFGTEQFDSPSNTLKHVTFLPGDTFGSIATVGTHIIINNGALREKASYDNPSNTLIVSGYNDNTRDINIFTATEGTNPTFTLSTANNIFLGFGDNFPAQIIGTTTQASRVDDNLVNLYSDVSTGGAYTNTVVYTSTASVLVVDLGIGLGMVFNEIDQSQSPPGEQTLFLFPSVTPIVIAGLVLGPLNLTY